MSASDAEDDPLALPVLTPEDMVAIENSRFRSAMEKILQGRALTKDENTVFQAAKARGMRPDGSSLPALPGQEPPLPPENSSFALHGESLQSLADIAAFYGLAAGKNGVRTVQRCNAIGRLPDVNCPPPWSDPRAMAEWYRIHYRSDPSKPARSQPKAVLPPWITNTLARLPSTLPAQPTALPSLVAAAPADPAAPLPDALATARAMLAQAHHHYLAVAHDPTAAPVASRAYLEILERVQQAEKRAKDSGETELRLRVLVDEKIDSLHRKLPSHLAAELASLRVEIHEASAAPETFAAWCAAFFAAVGQRLTRHHFAPIPS